MSDGFLAWARPRRLTWQRLVTTWIVCSALLALAIVLTPLLGVDLGKGGWHLAVLDPSAIWTAGTLDHDALWQVRVPRVLSAAVVGAALGASGVVFQAVLRNPLAEPFTLGVSSGAALAAVIAIRTGFDAALAGTGVGVAALIGAGLTVIVVWQLGRVGSALPPATLLLGGITVSMFCSSASMLVQHTADFVGVSRMLRWMMGGFTAGGYGMLTRAAPAIGLALIALLTMSRQLNALAAGPEAAASVGVAPGRAITRGFAVASLLVGASIAVSGPIGFVGLMVPHALRAVVGPDHRALLPASMLIGGTFLVACDTAARLVVPGDQIPVGVITALLGAPFFIGILIRNKRRASLWGPG
jgi:iron complex transport system permease protein